MRIVAGEFRGRRLHTPRGETIRPTADRVREAVFSILAPRVRDALVLDLYAGTGALGLEALSRGAAGVVFVDHDPGAIRLVRSNIELCGAEGRSRIIRAHVAGALRQLAAEGLVFSLIFLDPPYGKGHVEATLPDLHRVADAATLVVAEHNVKDLLPPTRAQWVRVQQRVYGDTAISFYECTPESPIS